MRAQSACTLLCFRFGLRNVLNCAELQTVLRSLHGAGHIWHQHTHNCYTSQPSSHKYFYTRMGKYSDITEKYLVLINRLKIFVRDRSGRSSLCDG